MRGTEAQSSMRGKTRKQVEQVSDVVTAEGNKKGEAIMCASTKVSGKGANKADMGGERAREVGIVILIASTNRCPNAALKERRVGEREQEGGS